MRKTSHGHVTRRFIFGSRAWPLNFRYGGATCRCVQVTDTRLQMEELLALVLQRIHMEESSMAVERECLNVVQNLEAVRRSWQRAEAELKRFKELLVKSDVAKAALEIQLKHARNQVDVEMRKRHKVEANYQYLERQMGLMCDILVQDGKFNTSLNDEQKNFLAKLNQQGANATLLRSTKSRLSVIDESSFLSHSDISYDRTEDYVDLDTTLIKPLRSRARERRRSSMPVGGPVAKRSRIGNVSAEIQEKRTIEKEVESIVKASVATPDAGGQNHMALGIKQACPDDPARSASQEGAVSVRAAGGRDQTSLWSSSNEKSVELNAPVEDRNVPVLHKSLRHEFLSKTVIRPETCTPCGKRIRFGKMAVKCRTCRLVAHPECKQNFPNSCSSSSTVTGGGPHKDSLEAFAPLTHPRVPQVIVDCVAEIERRGLHERGLYRVPGGERPVRNLRDRILQGKPSLMLSKVQDIHVVCGVLKDFLRRLREPLVTFRLHRIFMEASELDEDNGSAVLYRAVSELPKANRDTLAFLMIHLHKVMRSPQCQMDQNNLARVFGPTIVGHSIAEPSPTTIMKDTTIQPKVVCCLLSIPENYWRQVLIVGTDQNPSASSSSRLFQPLTSPELNSICRMTSPDSVRERIGNPGNNFSTTNAVEPGRKFFTSPC
ncbi:rac GTPase-activating protein 1 isoform X3 [Poecilia latipinna]|uniref:rac GTPase-activating protein 1 isoform X3 n=1 Tax=Poecilia latipinna TaxID=48699 RepID=UPI00072E9D7B|nr:PREDICTED: rac GTPase-activating protein 1-like isoform X3 [Poecilia latipinna]